jgi:pSer/pThr/pTyr-binding forkhead associated (FHA) protein
MPKITITLENDLSRPYRFDFNQKTVSIGRSEKNDIQIQSDFISLQHAEMRRVPGGFELHDLESRTGIKLNGYSQKSVPLVPGMILELGNAIFDFTLSDEEIAKLEKEKAKLSAANKANAQKTPAYTPSPLGRPSLYPPAQASSGVGFFGLISFIALAAAAFFGGAFARHKNETGKSLIDAVVSKFSSEQSVK